MKNIQLKKNNEYNITTNLNLTGRYHKEFPATKAVKEIGSIDAPR